MIDYITLQQSLIIDFQINIIQDSVCWKRTHAHTDGTRRICKFKIKNSYASLFTLCHEIGHIETDEKGMKRCESESEATKWAINKMKELGLPIKRKTISDYKAYIKMTYERGLRRGLKKKVKSNLYL